MLSECVGSGAHGDVGVNTQSRTVKPCKTAISTEHRCRTYLFASETAWTARRWGETSARTRRDGDLTALRRRQPLPPACLPAFGCENEAETMRAWIYLPKRVISGCFWRAWSWDRLGSGPQWARDSHQKARDGVPGPHGPSKSPSCVAWFRSQSAAITQLFASAVHGPSSVSVCDGEALLLSCLH